MQLSRQYKIRSTARKSSSNERGDEVRARAEILASAHSEHAQSRNLSFAPSVKVGEEEDEAE